jgi:hypothetical protein
MARPDEGDHSATRRLCRWNILCRIRIAERQWLIDQFQHLQRDWPLFDGRLKKVPSSVARRPTLACKIIARSRGNFMLGYLCIGMAKA